MRRLIDHLCHLFEQVLGAHQVFQLKVEEECGLTVKHALESELDDDRTVYVIEVDPALDQVVLQYDVALVGLGQRAALDLLRQNPLTIRLCKFVHAWPLRLAGSPQRSLAPVLPRITTGTGSPFYRSTGTDG